MIFHDPRSDIGWQRSLDSFSLVVSCLHGLWIDREVGCRLVSDRDPEYGETLVDKLKGEVVGKVLPVERGHFDKDSLSQLNLRRPSDTEGEMNR